MTVDLHLPQRPGGKPVVVVPIDHHSGVLVDPRCGHQLFELALRQDVASHGITKLAVPRPCDGTGHMAFLICLSVYIDLHDSHAGIGGVLDHPLGRHKRLRMRILSHRSTPVFSQYPFSLYYARSNFSWCSIGSPLTSTLHPRISSISCKYVF